MSAIGPKRTYAAALHMSAFGGKADMALCGNSLSQSLLGVKRTCFFALQMSAFDPKRTSGPDQHLRSGTCYFSLAAPERGGREIADYIGLSHTSMTEMKAIGRWHVGFPRKRKSSAHA